jgi:hypothetical protein
MRYKVFTTMTLFGLLIVPLAHAQSSRPLRADIPFDFGVKDKVLPAGNYQLIYDNSRGGVFISGLDQNGGAFASTILTGAVRQRDETALLVFNRYGHTYFLSQVWQGAGGRSVIELPKTRSERDLIARIPAPGVERASITVPTK